MTKSTVTLELKVSEGTRIRGWGEDATYEYNLRHERMTGEIKFRCKRRDIDKVLEELGANTESFEFDDNITIVDVGDELSRASTGMPLSERDQKELSSLVDQSSPTDQPKSKYKIRIG